MDDSVREKLNEARVEKVLTALDEYVKCKVADMLPQDNEDSGCYEYLALCTAQDDLRKVLAELVVNPMAP